MIPIDSGELSVWLKGVRDYFAGRGLVNINVEFRPDGVMLVRAHSERNNSRIVRAVPLLLTGRSKADIELQISSTVMNILHAFDASQGPPARNYTALEVTQRLMPDALKFMLPPEKPAAPKKPSVFERKPLRRKIHPDVV